MQSTVGEQGQVYFHHQGLIGSAGVPLPRDLRSQPVAKLFSFDGSARVVPTAGWVDQPRHVVSPNVRERYGLLHFRRAE